jgi:hypothetical protein
MLKKIAWGYTVMPIADGPSDTIAFGDAVETRRSHKAQISRDSLCFRIQSGGEVLLKPQQLADVDTA